MEWRQTYAVPDVSTAFLMNYGWSEIVGLRGELPSDRIACGFLLLGPSTYYARHSHAAEEIYVPLSGTALWQQAESPWREHLPGSVIHHDSNEPHAMRTQTQPLLALYLWHGNLQQKSHFV
jgi:Dimethlysulfonioproprionate lyase